LGGDAVVGIIGGHKRTASGKGGISGKGRGYSHLLNVRLTFVTRWDFGLVLYQ